MKVSLLLLTVVFLWVSLTNPIYPNQLMLQHIPTAFALLFLAFDTRQNWMTNSSFLCFMAFVWLHIVGAHHIYSYVPYDDWSTSIFGKPISDRFDWQRNHYDRLVHFCFGLLFVLPFFEIARNKYRLPLFGSVLFALFAVNALSAVYEIAEWVLSVVMSPEHAREYNGQQGDAWDAQKDMALALAGSFVAVPPVVFRARRRKPEPDQVAT